MSITTLEQVFLTISEKAQQKYGKKPENEEEIVQGEEPEEPDIDPNDEKEIKAAKIDTSNSFSFGSQFSALFVKTVNFTTQF